MQSAHPVRIQIHFLVWLTTLSVMGQGGVAERHEQATNHLKRVAAEISARCLTNISSAEDWRAAQPELLRQLKDSLGLEPLPKRTALRARVTGRLDRAHHSIEKVVFESLPGLYVTGNFYLPKDSPLPAPTILYLCGHAPHPAGAKFNYQDRAAAFAREGFACLIIDTLEFGEVPGIHHGLHDLNMWHWLSLGYTPAGVEVWNAMRALDYLETRPEVDPKRIGLTGISGGGAITWYTAALDERVAAAVPVCSTYTFGSQATNWRAWGQCDCIYFHNTYHLDFPVVAALIAPRPLLMISGRRDADFPPDGYHEVFARARRIYEFHGADDRVAELDDDVGHSDTPEFKRAARAWMRRWLQSDMTPLSQDGPGVSLESPEDLACLDEVPVDALNFKIHNQFLPTIKISERLRRPNSQRHAEILAGLKEQVFRWFPAKPIPFETEVSRNTGGWVPRYANYKEVTFQTEPGVRVRAQLLTPTNRTEATPLLLYVKRPGDSIYFMDFDELLPVLGSHAVLILNPRFTEKPVSAAEYRDIQMTAAWSGRTIEAMQTWDILRALQWIAHEERTRPSSISIYGKGEMGVLALYAALLDSAVNKVVLNRPPFSHWDGPALLNILRITDTPEVSAALGAGKVVSLTRLPANFGTTHAASLPEALALPGGRD